MSVKSVPWVRSKDSISPKIDYKQLENDPFQAQPYLSNMKLSQARLRFKLNSFMTPTVKINFMSNEQYRRENYSCWDCASIDTQSHIKTCFSYEELRRGKDLEDDVDLVNYFQQLIDKRQSSMN